MASGFVSFRALLNQLENASFERPPAIVCNAHITGLGVARALNANEIPVIAIDQTGTGVAPGSTAVEYAGHVTYPPEDPDGFKENIEQISAVLGHEPVVFPCMDEWVLGLAETDPAGVHLPFAESDVIDAVLNKRLLYQRAETLGVPYPETYYLNDTSPAEAAESLGFPLVVKPAYKREFEDAIGTNVVEVETQREFSRILDQATTHGIEVMAQERIPIEQGSDCSLGSYVPRETDREPVTFVGNPVTRFPQSFGTSCVVQPTDEATVRDSALTILENAGYYGISEAEFVYHETRDEYVLLDINTRPWKWIGLPVAAGANLPLAAYAEAVGIEYEPDRVADVRWVYLPDYLKLLATTPSFTDVLNQTDWEALITGSFEQSTPPPITTGVYAPNDPAPLYQVLQNEFTTTEYYCAC